MTKTKPTDCIYCGSPAGSAEHTILASLGGLRKDRGILCGPCNNRFGETIDGALARDMGPINAIVGVMNGRTREPISTTVEDLAAGRMLRLTNGRKLSHPDVAIVSESMQAGVRIVQAVASTQKQVDNFVHLLKQEGNSVEVTGREKVPSLFASTPILQWRFGGADSFRCVARLVVNIIATCRPTLARESWLTPLKKFIISGGDPAPWVHYAYQETSSIPTSFTFGHRFVLVFDAASGKAYAHVSLFGVIELAVRLGKSSFETSETIVYEMDALAQCPPLDINVTKLPGIAYHFPAEETIDPSVHVPDRITNLLARRNGWLWSQDSPRLLDDLNAVRHVAPFERHNAIFEALDGQQQRLLNIAAFVVGSIRRHMTELFGVHAGSEVSDAFSWLVQPDATSPTGVTALTRSHADMLRYIMADHLLAILDNRPVEDDELRLILEGPPGVAIVARYMTDVIRQKHPLLSNDHS